uniref:Secreted protein n=1 Tax=Trypanosoma congolense (strain IL3000) TaxID=1068625 RepID=G0URN9_TRYCI|nr:hypothetical protein, unlikely [Trypanosoma congolense IL3000]
MCVCVCGKRSGFHLFCVALLFWRGGRGGTEVNLECFWRSVGPSVLYFRGCRHPLPCLQCRLPLRSWREGEELIVSMANFNKIECKEEKTKERVFFLLNVAL